MFEYHYAPLTGGLQKRHKDTNEIVSIASWSEYHELFREFLKLREDNKIELIETIEYGHSLHHGHRGIVQIYT